MNLAPSLRRPLLFVALAAVSGVAPFACSGPADLRTLDDPKPKTHHDAGKKDSGPKDAGDVDAADHAACNDYAAIICAKLDSCTGNVNVAENYSSNDECIVREALSCITSLDAPDNAASAAGIERCGAGIMAGSCGDFFDHTNFPSSCIARPGPRPNGAACAFNGQCDSTWCYLPASAACGTCTTRPEAGAPCAVNGDCGGQSLHCSSGIKTCEPVVASGSVCDATHLCPYEESCVVPDGGTSGLCTVRGALGSACDAKLTKAPLCANDFGYFCPSATDICAPITAAFTDQTCGTLAGVVVNGVRGPSHSAVCYGGTDCFPTTTSSGFCTPPAADGQPCDSVLGPSCENPARCVPKNPANDASTAGTCLVIGVGTDYCSPPSAVGDD